MSGVFGSADGYVRVLLCIIYIMMGLTIVMG